MDRLTRTAVAQCSAHALVLERILAYIGRQDRAGFDALKAECLAMVDGMHDAGCVTSAITEAMAQTTISSVEEIFAGAKEVLDRR